MSYYAGRNNYATLAEGDTLFYYFSATANDGTTGQTAVLQTIHREHPTEEQDILLITQNDRNVDFALYSHFDSEKTYWWNCDEFDGIPADILEMFDFRILMIAGWGVELFPMKADDGWDDVLGLANFIENGGKVIYSDQDCFWKHNEYANSLVFSSGDFAYDIFCLVGGVNDPENTGVLYRGAENTPTEDFLDNDFGPMNYEENGWANWSDFVYPNENTQTIFIGQENNESVAVMTENTMYFGVNIELAPANELQILIDSILDLWWECIPGDVNGDEILNILDVLGIVNCILEQSNECDCADYNEDGAVNVIDIISLITLLLEE